MDIILITRKALKWYNYKKYGEDIDMEKLGERPRG
jgi:hypothetical protein